MITVDCGGTGEESWIIIPMIKCVCGALGALPERPGEAGSPGRIVRGWWVPAADALYERWKGRITCRSLPLGISP